jgi:hypothetical protein
LPSGYLESLPINNKQNNQIIHKRFSEPLSRENSFIIKKHSFTLSTPNESTLNEKLKNFVNLNDQHSQISPENTNKNNNNRINRTISKNDNREINKINEKSHLETITQLSKIVSSPNFNANNLNFNLKKSSSLITDHRDYKDKDNKNLTATNSLKIFKSKSSDEIAPIDSRVPLQYMRKSTTTPISKNHFIKNNNQLLAENSANGILSPYGSTIHSASDHAFDHVSSYTSDYTHLTTRPVTRLTIGI